MSASAGCHATCLVSFGFAEGCGGPKTERGTLITLPGGCRNSKCTFIFALYLGVPSGLRSLERRTCEIATVALIRVPSVKLNMTTFDPATLASTTSASTWSSANCFLPIQNYRFLVPLTLMRNSSVKSTVDRVGRKGVRAWLAFWMRVIHLFSPST